MNIWKNHKSLIIILVLYLLLILLPSLDNVYGEGGILEFWQMTSVFWVFVIFFRFITKLVKGVYFSVKGIKREKTEKSSFYSRFKPYLVILVFYSFFLSTELSYWLNTTLIFLGITLFSWYFIIYRNSTAYKQKMVETQKFIAQREKEERIRKRKEAEERRAKEKARIAAEKRREERMLVEEEKAKILENEKRYKIRAKAEKELYGEVKTKRIPLSDKDKEGIFKKYNYECSACGTKEGLHIHHKDHNPANNKTSNLTVLCGLCHKKVHMKVR